MITQEQADYLIKLEKHCVDGENIKVTMSLLPKIPINDRIYLVAKEDADWSFFLDINQSRKNHLKITLHFQEDITNIGLLRVDFGGRHENPVAINDKVPEYMSRYSGQWIDQSHIHYYIEGYKPLAWAIPLMDDSFSIKKYTGRELNEIFNEFGHKINLKTNVTIQGNLL
jgi:hypothetical protein